MAHTPASGKRLEVVELGKGTYLEGRKLCRKNGFRQISSPLADELIMGKDPRIDPRITRACWTEDLAAYPEKNGTFRKGENITDALHEDRVLLWSDVVRLCPASEFAEMKKIALLVTPSADKDNFTEKHKGSLIVRPERIIVIPGFLQENGWGTSHKETGLVLESTAGKSHERFLWRTYAANLAPVARGFYGLLDRRDVILDDGPSYRLGVVGVRESETPADDDFSGELIPKTEDAPDDSKPKA